MQIVMKSVISFINKYKKQLLFILFFIIIILLLLKFKYNEYYTSPTENSNNPNTYIIINNENAEDYLKYYLQIRELEVFTMIDNREVNIARGALTDTSSYYTNNPPMNAIDGDRDTFYHSYSGDKNQWFRLKFNGIYNIHKITYYNRLPDPLHPKVGYRANGTVLTLNNNNGSKEPISYTFNGSSVQTILIDPITNKVMNTIYNPTEDKRTYSTIFENSPIGTGNALSMLDSVQAWSAASNDTSQYMTLDLDTTQTVLGSITQGRVGRVESVAITQWVTTYKVSYSIDNSTYIYITSSGIPSNNINDAQLFTGNLNDNTKIENYFIAPIQARYIRYHPYEWFGHISMRAGVLIKPIPTLETNTTSNPTTTTLETTTSTTTTPPTTTLETTTTQPPTTTLGTTTTQPPTTTTLMTTTMDTTTMDTTTTTPTIMYTTTMGTTTTQPSTIMYNNTTNTTTSQPIMNDITQLFPNLSSETIVSFLNSGVDLMKLYSDTNYISDKGMNFDSEMRSPSTNIYQKNFSGTSNVYSPYLYYNKNCNDNQQPEELNSIVGSSNYTMANTTTTRPSTTMANTTTTRPSTTMANTTTTRPSTTMANTTTTRPSTTMTNTTTTSQPSTTMTASTNQAIIDLAVSASGINSVSNEPFSNLLFNQNTINKKIISNKQKFNNTPTPIIFNTLSTICNNMSEYIRIFFPLINIDTINNSVKSRQNVDLDTMIKNVYNENDNEFGLKLLYFAKGANFINYYSIAYIMDEVYACICLILHGYHSNKFSNNNYNRCSYIVEPIDYTQKSLMQYYGLCNADTLSVINIINSLSNTDPISEINIFQQQCSNTENELCKINSYNTIKNTVYNYLSNNVDCIGFTDLECNKKKDDFLSDLKNNNVEQQRLLRLFEINIANYFINLCNSKITATTSTTPTGTRT